MQAAMIAKKPRKQAISGRFWAARTYRGRIKDDHKIDCAAGSGGEGVQLYTERVSFHSQKAVHRHLSSRRLHPGLQHYKEGMGAEWRDRPLWQCHGA